MENRACIALLTLLASGFLAFGCSLVSIPIPGLGPTAAPYPIGLQNETGLVPGRTTRLEVIASFGEPPHRDLVAGRMDQGWWYPQVALYDFAGARFEADLMVFFKDPTDDTVLEIALHNISPTVTANEVVAQYGPPEFVELAAPNPALSQDTANPPSFAWSALVYPTFGTTFELRCGSSPLREGCQGVRRDDPVTRKFYFAPQPADDWYQAMSKYGFMTITHWTGFADEPGLHTPTPNR